VAKRKPVLIGCPQYRKLVRGNYSCDESGRYLFGSNGRFVLKLICCGQDGGRCMQTLCALHRFNRRGSSTWFPGQVLAMRERPGGRSAQPRPKRRSASSIPGATDVLA